jgi:hypothetical protein
MASRSRSGYCVPDAGEIVLQVTVASLQNEKPQWGEKNNFDN